MRFAHRGVHVRADEENTLSAFRRALRTMDGFECDVRLSRDGVPVLVHDATLERTHGIDRRVDRMTADELADAGVPTLEEALGLLRTTSGVEKGAILDLKTSEQTLIRKASHLARRLRVRPSALTFLVWNRLRAPPPTHATVLRAVDYSFRTHHPHVDGLACKYDGGLENVRCIDRALEAGLEVNLWPPNPSDLDDMVERYGDSCSLTVGI